jgi:hypothetical protein
MNQITYEDFGLFRDELLQVDFITLNLNKLSDSQILQLANYFQNLGFNCYQRKAETSQSRQEVYANYKKYYGNPFELEFILNVPYQKDIMQIQFPGLSAKQFYKLVKQGSIQWEKLTPFSLVLSRFDLVYQRVNKSTDKATTKEFLNSSYIEFQELHPYKNLLSERNRKGLVLKIGNRKGRRYYRIYTSKHQKSLRFEAEMKGDLIQDFRDLFFASTFDQQEFESRLSYEFFKYSFQLFVLSIQTSHIDWLIQRIRPYQQKNSFLGGDPIIHSHYLNQMDFKLMKEKQHLVTLLQLLVFVRGLTYTPGKLDAKYRKYTFPLREFLNYTKKATNQYQLNKLKDFFDLVRENFIIESFSDSHYRMLVTIPEVKVTKSQQNIWNVDIWIAEELFDYLHPFMFPDLFNTKLPSYQFQVLFEVIKVYCSNDIRKEFHIQQFLDNYPSKLSGEQKKQIKKYFLSYLQILHQRDKIQDKVLDLSSHKILNIHDLNTSHLLIAVFETIDIKFN